MSLWYDVKKKSYAYDAKTSWIKSYVERLVSAIRGEVNTTLGSHYSGDVGRHSASDVECESGNNVEQALLAEAAGRQNADSILEEQIEAEAENRRIAVTQVQNNVNAEAQSRQAGDEALADMVKNETAEREGALQTLQENIDAETIARNSALSLKVDKISGKGLSTNDFTNTYKEKLSLIEDGAQVNLVKSVAGKKGVITLTKEDVGLSNVDNTSDASKPISTAVQAALNEKASVSALNEKASVSEVLTKTNTIEYNPTEGYNPATKKYVDETVASISSGGEIDLSGYALAEDLGNIRKNPAATDGDLIPTHLTVGKSNTALEKGSVITGGLKLTVADNGTQSVSDAGNSTAGISSAVVGGTENVIDLMFDGAACSSFVSGSAIIGGKKNKIHARPNSTVVGGYNNEIWFTYDTEANEPEKGCPATIVGGRDNTINLDGGDNCVVVGGRGNTIDGHAENTVILGGKNNNVTSIWDHCNNSVLLSGNNNVCGPNQIVGGHFSPWPVEANETGTVGDAFVIGNGTSDSVRTAAFRVTYDGSVYGLSAFNSSGADYAEYFEWADANADGEDRRGKFVALDGDKIRLATAEDDYILGVVSSTPSIVGDSQSEIWQGMYLKDVFGNYITEPIEVPAVINERTGEIEREGYTYRERVLNPEYNPEMEYISREKRPEWTTVGMVGKLVATDDGSCEAGGYCAPGRDGIATASSSGYKVIKRIDNSHIQIIVK